MSKQRTEWTSLLLTTNYAEDNFIQISKYNQVIAEYNLFLSQKIKS